MTSAKEPNRQCGQNTDLILKTGFIEDAGAFSYVFCNLRAIRSERECDDKQNLHIQKGHGLCPLE